MGEQQQEQQQWVIDLRSELANISFEDEVNKYRKCIYRVPKVKRDINKEAYTPQVVSFGPYHHGKAHLKPMERHKLLALDEYLKRANKTLEQVVEAFRPVVQDLMDSYESLEEPWTDKERFLHLMILDGCFLLELILTGIDDRMAPFIHREIEMDRLKLENQLPFLVLVILIEEGGYELEDAAALESFLGYPAGQLDIFGGAGWGSRHHHLLDLQKRSHTNYDQEGCYFHDSRRIVPPAMELCRAGVTFEPSKTCFYHDISFRNGVLRIPTLYYTSNTEAQLLNYIAYENLHRYTDSTITQFVLFMNNIIDKDKDVALLREKKIIACSTGSDGQVASLFNRLGASIEGVPIVLHGLPFNVNKDLEEYCNKRWHKWRAIFKQNYLSNPWVFSSLVAAFILLVLTMIQTTYTVVPYYTKH